MTTGDISKALASFIVASRWEDIPAPVRHEGKRSLVNAFATGLGGCRDVAVECAVATLQAFSGPAEASLIGRSERLRCHGRCISQRDQHQRL